MNQSTNGANGVESKYSPNEIKEIALSDILADFQWNSRGQKWRQVGQPGQPTPKDNVADEGHSILDLMNSLAERGQDDPIVLRPNVKPDGSPGKGGKFLIVCGFRRFEATKRNAEKLDTKHPTIRAVIRTDLNEATARSLNMRENTARDNLSGPDLAWGIYTMHVENKKAGIPDSAKSIAEDIGKNQAWVNQLLTIMKNAQGITVKVDGKDVPMATAWRDAEMPLSANAMKQVTDVKEPEGRIVKFEELSKAQAEKAAGKDKTKPGDAWVMREKATAEKAGFTLGHLKALGHVEFSGGKMAWVAKAAQEICNIRELKSKENPEGATQAQVDSIVEAMKAGILKGLEEPGRMAAEAEQAATDKEEKAAAAKEKHDAAREKAKAKADKSATAN